MSKKALFAVSTLGLGHATRTLPIIKHYLQKGFQIDLVSYWNALAYLKQELQWENVRFLDLVEYPALERGTGIIFFLMLVPDLLITYIRICQEEKFLKKLEKKSDYCFIFSDGKYWFSSKKTKSYLLSHQLAFEIPRPFCLAQGIMDYFNQTYFKKFDMIFIPDYENTQYNLAGKLSHPAWIKNIKHKYIGILSSLTTHYEENKQKTIDYLFTISGYLLNHKKSFIKKLLEEAKSLKGSKVFLLWDSKQKDYYHHDTKNNIEIFGCLGGKEKEIRFQQAKTIIARAGYTTIMDLIELNKPAILFPTPYQTEQTYLAKYLKKKNYFVIGKEKDQLLELIKHLKKTEKFAPPSKTKEALEIIYSTIQEQC